ncbi:MAG: hypothetical protein IIW48_07430 [Clostridia bacterium]|nr:hypothetical protein [Clostridia bacterium]
MANTFYEIKKNDQYNSNEVYFNGKPSEEVRNALKGLKMRWNRAKCCWYGYATENAIISAITCNTAADDFGGTVSDGYLGATAWNGNHSGKYLHGKELSKAVRESFKIAGVKGVSVSCKTYAGGQNLTITVKVNSSDFISESEFVANYQVCTSGWIYTSLKGECIHVDEYFGRMTAEEQQKTREVAARCEYQKYTQREQSLNQYYLSEYKMFTPEFAAKLQLINRIILSYNYDDSNGMVDYFNTNFYYSIYTKPESK